MHKLRMGLATSVAKLHALRAVARLRLHGKIIHEGQHYFHLLYFGSLFFGFHDAYVAVGGVLFGLGVVGLLLGEESV